MAANGDPEYLVLAAPAVRKPGDRVPDTIRVPAGRQWPAPERYRRFLDGIETGQGAALLYADLDSALTAFRAISAYKQQGAAGAR